VIGAILQIIASFLRLIPGWYEKRVDKNATEWKNNREAIDRELGLLLGGCATTSPITNTTGAVESLMKDDNYPAVRTASPAIRAWAKKALDYVNDLSYELQRERNK